MFKNANYLECAKDKLIADYEDYIEYVRGLVETGEIHREPIVSSVPQELIKAKRVFCAKGCSATHYIEGQCFLWKYAQRKSMQDLDRRAKEEAKRIPACKDRWKNLKKSDFHIDYDWKNTYKYKNKDTEEYKNLGEDIWTPLKN